MHFSLPIMLFRLLLAVLISHFLHPLYPPDFDLSAAAPPCRVFARPAFSQHDCGACVAFAVATAAAMRACARDGRDWIPSPYRLFDCADGTCSNGTAAWRVVETMNRADVQDVDEDPGKGVFGRECEAVDHWVGFPSLLTITPRYRRHLSWPHRLTAFFLPSDDAWLLKTELYVFRNPVLVVVEPDVAMSYYMPQAPGLADLPVYHITGPPLHPHMMVAFGWGTVPEPHWLVQNSWGERWGHLGRGRLAVGDVQGAVVLDAAVWRTDWSMVAVAWAALGFALVWEWAAERWGWGCCCCGGDGAKELAQRGVGEGKKRDKELV